MKGMVIKLKRIIILAGFAATIFCFGLTAYADETMKISMTGEVKEAKTIGSGKGISFSLPDVDSKFLINTIELAVFEKKETDTQYSLFGESKLLENPTSLTINFDFGDVSKYQERSRYKIAYRYYVQPIDDLSKIIIAGQDVKDGWRLVGEVNPSQSTQGGFAFYKNAVPSLLIEGISYQAETISGINTFSYDVSQLKNVYLPVKVLQNGVKINYLATDFDGEDILTIGYQLFDGITNELISAGSLNNSATICSNTDAELVKVILSATDNWGGKSTEQTLLLKIDNEAPSVINQFADMGKALRGKNLYSKFTIADDQNDALTSGNVYYSIKRAGKVLYENVRLPNNASGFYTVDLTNMSDGTYEIILTIFDKAYNKTVHTLTQTLDNTAPTARLLTPEENALSTAYSAWTNQSKKIIISAEDDLAGLQKCNGYRNYSFFTITSLSGAPKQYTFNFSVTTTMTGKIYHYFYIYDDARTIDKTNNTINTSSSGNSCFLSEYVWLDKTPPDVSINADSNTWYPVPSNITVDCYDSPSSDSVDDNSGVKSVQYCVTETESSDDTWIDYSSGVTFEQGGVYYLHIKAVDFAGNETIETKRIMLNTLAKIISEVRPTEDSRHTIYNEFSGMYIVKNTAFATQYHLTLQDEDITDILRTQIRLESQDNAEYVSQTEVETVPDGAKVHNVVFHMPYIKADGSPLPDGVYTMYISINEVKNDGTVLKTIENMIGCEVVIKRNAPPIPVINVSGGTVSIDYPSEALSASLNRADIKALYRREYKAVLDGQPGSNTYNTYISPIEIDNMVVTALYTDMAGNISTASKRIYKEDTGSASSIITEGNTVTVEESRPANTYYIGTRREKQAGIDSRILNFLN